MRDVPLSSAGADDAEWRHHALEGVLNLRDFGGYGCASAELPRGRLYRSGHMARATEADLTALHALDLAVIVDLRSDVEREDQPSRRHPAFAGRVIEAPDSQHEGAPHHVGGAMDVDAVRARMVESYRGLPWRPPLLVAFAQTFEALANGEGPILIHCAAGKDRTGLLAALIHHVAGVSDADVMQDYLLTNRVKHPPERRARFARWMAEAYGAMPSEAAIDMALGVEPVFLETAWAAMRDRHGSVDGYLEQALGVTPERRRRVEATLRA